MEIVDTAGQEEFTSFLDSSLATGDAFMVLYAINSLSSWNELKTLRSKINQETESLGNKTVPMIVVGNKRVSDFSSVMKQFASKSGSKLRSAIGSGRRSKSGSWLRSE